MKKMMFLLAFCVLSSCSISKNCTGLGSEKKIDSLRNIEFSLLRPEFRPLIFERDEHEDTRGEKNREF